MGGRKYTCIGGPKDPRTMFRNPGKVVDSLEDLSRRDQVIQQRDEDRMEKMFDRYCEFFGTHANNRDMKYIPVEKLLKLQEPKELDKLAQFHGELQALHECTRDRISGVPLTDMYRLMRDAIKKNIVDQLPKNGRLGLGLKRYERIKTHSTSETKSEYRASLRKIW